jgi:hypothetical protein
MELNEKSTSFSNEENSFNILFFFFSAGNGGLFGLFVFFV